MAAGKKRERACLADAGKLFLVGWLVISCHGNGGAISRANTTGVTSIGHHQGASFDESNHLPDINLRSTSRSFAMRHCPTITVASRSYNPKNWTRYQDIGRYCEASHETPCWGSSEDNLGSFRYGSCQIYNFWVSDCIRGAYSCAAGLRTVVIPFWPFVVIQGILRLLLLVVLSLVFATCTKAACCNFPTTRDARNRGQALPWESFRGRISVGHWAGKYILCVKRCPRLKAGVRQHWIASASAVVSALKRLSRTEEVLPSTMLSCADSSVDPSLSSSSLSFFVIKSASASFVWESSSEKST